MFDREKAVRHLIDRELRPEGIGDERVLGAIERVKRERFVPESLRDRAYDNHPLPIGESQTISQPYIVALMTQALALGKGDKALEVGTGSGYQTAVLAELAGTVYSIERIESLALRARTNLYSQGYSNIILIVGDGTKGLPEYAPFDKIIVTAAAPHVPDPLLEQLACGGKLVVPVGGKSVQDLQLVEKALNGRVTRRSLGGVRFVPLIGTEAWRD